MTKNTIIMHWVDLEDDQVSEAKDYKQAREIFYFGLLLGKDPRAIKVFSNDGNSTEDFFQLINNEV